jgi:histidine triad (HIT) family protein
MLYTGIHVNHAHAHIVPMHHRHDITSAVYLEQGIEAFTLPAQPPVQELEEVAAALRRRLAP